MTTVSRRLVAEFTGTVLAVTINPVRPVRPVRTRAEEPPQLTG